MTDQKRRGEYRKRWKRRRRADGSGRANGRRGMRQQQRKTASTPRTPSRLRMAARPWTTGAPNAERCVSSRQVAQNESATQASLPRGAATTPQMMRIWLACLATRCVTLIPYGARVVSCDLLDLATITGSTRRRARADFSTINCILFAHGFLIT